MRNWHFEHGFSMIKLLFWLAVACFLAFSGASIFQAKYTNWKVQDSFDGLVDGPAQQNSLAARAKLDELIRLQYLDKDDLPAEFYNKLQIKVTGDILEVSSSYSVTVWPFGKVADVDEDGTYDPDSLSGMDALRDKTRIDLVFKPYAISGSGRQ